MTEKGRVSRSKIFWPVSMLLLSALSCRPVITVGWGEMLLLVVVVALILGPLLLRMIRRIRGDQKSNIEEGNGEEKAD